MWNGFVTRWLASEAFLKALEGCDPHYPELSEEELAAMEACRPRLS